MKNTTKETETALSDKPLEDMTSAELDRLTKITRLRKEIVTVRSLEFTQAEKERSVCSITSAMAQFNTFLLPIKDFLQGLPDAVSDIVSELTPTEYDAIQTLIYDQTEMLADRLLTFKLEDTRSASEAAGDMQREKKRKANRLAGKDSEAKR